MTVKDCNGSYVTFIYDNPWRHGSVSDIKVNAVPRLGSTMLSFKVYDNPPGATVTQWTLKISIVPEVTLCL